MFVDDDVFYVKNYFSHLLRDRIDCELTVSDNVDDALSKIQNNIFDIIVLDLMMHRENWEWA